MEILKRQTGVLGVNTYLVSGNGTEAFVVDPGGDAPEILAAAAERGWQIRAVLLTHGHFDHIGALRQLQQAGAEVYVSDKDAPMLLDNTACLAAKFGFLVEPCQADRLFCDGETLFLCGVPVQVLKTPGHTPGSVCFLAENVLFSGDTLFYGSVGRTDFPGGDHECLVESIRQQLFILPESVRVLPGHGEETTIENEKKYNPFVR